MSKKVKVVNFKSEGFGPLIFRTSDSQFHFHQYYSIMQSMGDEHHNLYYVQREHELKKDEWAIQFNDIGSEPVEVFKWKYDSPPAPEAVIYKIIASTNSEIKECPGISNWQINQFCIEENEEVELKTENVYIEPPETMHSNRGHSEEQLVLDDNGNVKLENEFEAAMVDWNKYSMDQYAEHLYNEFMFLSSGTAKCACELVRNYKDTKEGLKWVLKEYIDNVNDEDAIVSKLKELIGDD